MGDRIPIHKCPDPFMMNENEVNAAVAQFLISKDVEVEKVAVNKEKGYDVFGHGQINSHLGDQILYVLKQYEYSSEKTLIMLANPFVPRIKDRPSEVSLALDNLGVVRLWVKKDKSVEIKYPEEIFHVLSSLEMI